ncbi:Endonuclease YncB, thermonuclease family [Moheibacter sediminis]|uniref:Endonuclease YncB, thermonuclease family n=2 Tax=Moheibacter sediminis TaxID=1434700 RepID=A0A1W1Z1R7_9FLAO|nr:Endonuclease YncB, thermonuclease family [Moheibacter sediminis]
MVINLIYIALLLFVSCSSPQVQITESNAEITSAKNNSENNFTAKVIRIIDGDTIEVLYHELPVTIRLEHIDCPEKKQPFGTKAKQTLSELCFGQNIEIEFNGDKDRNGRYICVLYNEDGTNINKKMISLGMAWHFKKYSKDNSYAELENEARKNKVGLWQESNPIPPWDWRK